MIYCRFPTGWVSAPGCASATIYQRCHLRWSEILYFWPIARLFRLLPHFAHLFGCPTRTISIPLVRSIDCRQTKNDGWLMWDVLHGNLYIHTLNQAQEPGWEGRKKGFVRDPAHTKNKSQEYPIFTNLKKRFKHIELPAKLLDYFLRSNESNIHQSVVSYTHDMSVCWKVWWYMVVNVCVHNKHIHITPPVASVYCIPVVPLQIGDTRSSDRDCFLDPNAWSIGSLITIKNQRQNRCSPSGRPKALAMLIRTSTEYFMVHTLLGTTQITHTSNFILRSEILNFSRHSRDLFVDKPE